MKKFLIIVSILIVTISYSQEQQLPGLIETGFYDDFASDQEYTNANGTGVYWWGSDIGPLNLSRDNGSGLFNISHAQGNYEPIVISFLKTLDSTVTIDLSNAKIKYVLKNESADSIRVKFGFVDTLGRVGDFEGEIINDYSNNYWKYRSYDHFGPGETREIVRDFAGAKGVDWNYNFNCQGPCLIHPDLSIINNIYFTVVNALEDYKDDYHSFQLEGTKVRLIELKVGFIEEEDKNILLEKDVPTIIDNEKKSEFSIYPNPVQSLVSISEAGSLTIYSADGIEMFQETVEAGSSVNVADWSNGIYFVKLINEAGEFTTSFVKQ